MNFIQLIKDLKETWRIEIDKRREQKALYRIEYAFTSGGKKYYCYSDITNLPWARGRAALSCFNEIEMRCSREFLLQYTKAIDEVLHENKIDIFRINQLNAMLKDRLSLTADIDLCYRLASIVYFDASEKPEVWEPEYAEKKIARWKKDMDVESFFMQRPLKELMPFLTNAVGDLNRYSMLNEQLNGLHQDLMRLTTSIKSNKTTTIGKKS